MDDLISRKAAIAFAKDQIRKETGLYSKGRNTGIRIMKSALNNPAAIPSVEAVPLEPLCQWLAGYAAPPNYALDEVCDDSIDPESLVYTANDRAKAWKYHFRELLKSGLMDTEGEDAEEKA